MQRSIVFMFSGQGSQYYQMGRELFEHHTVFRKWMFLLDDIVRDLMGESVLLPVYDQERQRTGPFVHVRHTHPAIFMVEYSLAQVLLESGIEPDYLLGSSLGEFASAALAGIMRVEDLLKAVLKQAECFETYCEKGGMLAVIHDAALYNATPLIHENSELASISYDSHFVVSGETEKLKQIERYLKNGNILFQCLPVTYGFHSSYIDPAAPAFNKYLQQKSCQTPRIPFVSCLSGTLMPDVPTDYLWKVVRRPIQFPKAIRELENGRDCIYLDLGPGGTLANFAKRNFVGESNSESHAIMTLFNQDIKNLEKIKGLFPAKISF